MKAIDKVLLIEAIAIKLDTKFDYQSIDIYLQAFQIPIVDLWEGNKKNYVKDRLRFANEDTLIEMAEELELNAYKIAAKSPKNWEKITAVKAFISHRSEDKDKATRIREILKPYNIDCFVAHKDIKPSKEWQEEIQAALNTMDIFISMHSAKFSQSFWCQQEIGFAVARNVKIIPIKFDENPEGFIAKYQALIRGEKKADQVGKEILNILQESEDTRELYERMIAPSTLEEEDIPF